MNIHFVLMAKSQTPAEAIAEAHVLARQFGSDLRISVRQCGTGMKIADVYANGDVEHPNQALGVEKLSSEVTK